MPQTFRFASPLRTSSVLLAPLEYPEGARVCLSFILHTISGLHWPRLHHYYGCHLLQRHDLLEFPLEGRYQAFRLDRDKLPRLIHRLPVHRTTLLHALGLITYRALPYFAGLPTRFAASRFIGVVCCAPPIASFRPHRCQ